jgi:hypothetical protein
VLAIEQSVEQESFQRPKDKERKLRESLTKVVLAFFWNGLEIFVVLLNDYKTSRLVKIIYDMKGYLVPLTLSILFIKLLNKLLFL